MNTRTPSIGPGRSTPNRPRTVRIAVRSCAIATADAADPSIGSRTLALLVAGPSLTDGEAEAMARFVFDRARDLVALGSIQGAQISRATARELLTVPLHRGALPALGGN